MEGLRGGGRGTACVVPCSGLDWGFSTLAMWGANAVCIAMLMAQPASPAPQAMLNALWAGERPVAGHIDG
jgi:hypothetical protein